MTNKMAARVLTYELRRIAELWQFKAQKEEKVLEKDRLAIFKGQLQRKIHPTFLLHKKL